MTRLVVFDQFRVSDFDLSATEAATCIYGIKVKRFEMDSSMFALAVPNFPGISSDRNMW